ncbi:peptidase E [Saccharothrix coeruleofusca]|uniref:peptidase E n=1 Tax=Saccharothrix coeruleofusca TaxID=33919 RepID=UPI0027DACB33|nr:peptidase E [Saccharothrix coeruleofusca]MBP2340140.1 peptidase E [Saccharothrix coeruleofusca]
MPGHILATSMGCNRARDPWQPGPIFDYAFDLTGASTRRLCVLTTAGGDQEATIRQFHAAFEGTSVELSHLVLFDKPNVADVEQHLRGQDVIWVDRGSLVNLLAVWRAHQVDRILRDCWLAGVVLAGESAGSLCWHEGGTTDSFGDVRGVRDGLGLVPFSNAVHYGERRDLFRDLIGSGELPKGYATDAGAGLHYEGTELVAAVSDRENACAYRVERQADGSVREEPLDVRRLKRS